MYPMMRATMGESSLGGNLVGRWAAPLAALLFAAFLTCEESAAQANEALRQNVTVNDGPVRHLIDFPSERVEIKEWMKHHGWRSKINNPHRFEMGNGHLRLVSVNDSVLIGTERGFPINVHEWPRLLIRLRVVQNPRNTDFANRSGDDAAFRLYVAFDRGKGLFHPPHTIAYAWTEKVKPGTLVNSPFFKQVRYLSIGTGLTADEGDKAGKAAEHSWVTLERNLLKDYQLAFPDEQKEVPSLVGIMLKCDSNNTKSYAESWLSELTLLAPKVVE